MSVNGSHHACEDVFHLVSVIIFFHLVCEDVFALVSVNVSHHACEDVFHLVSVNFEIFFSPGE